MSRYGTLDVPNKGKKEKHINGQNMEKSLNFKKSLKNQDPLSSYI